MVIGEGGRLGFLPRGVWRARFNCETVRRDVIRIELERTLKRLTPTDWRLSRNAEHEIQADAAHSGGTRGFHRSSHVARFVTSSQRLYLRCHKGLNADRKSCDARGHVRIEIGTAHQLRSYLDAGFP